MRIVQEKGLSGRGWPLGIISRAGPPPRRVRHCAASVAPDKSLITAVFTPRPDSWPRPGVRDLCNSPRSTRRRRLIQRGQVAQWTRPRRIALAADSRARGQGATVIGGELRRLADAIQLGMRRCTVLGLGMFNGDFVL